MGRDNGKIKVQNGYELAQPFNDWLKTFKVQLKGIGFLKYLKIVNLKDSPAPLTGRIS